MIKPSGFVFLVGVIVDGVVAVAVIPHAIRIVVVLIIGRVFAVLHLLVEGAAEMKNSIKGGGNEVVQVIMSMGMRT